MVWTQFRHPHAFFAGCVLHRKRHARRCQRRLGHEWRGRRLDKRRQDVALEHLTALAGARNRRGIETIVGSDFSGGR